MLNKYKKSVGIACCRILSNNVDILMIKKKYTYAFFDFVFSRYKENSEEILTKLFSKMTLLEKLDILNFDFDLLWSRIRHNISPNNSDNEMANYKRSKENFRKLINKFDLKDLMKKTKSVDTVWEIPKGRQKYKENPINTAYREFMEETTLTLANYVLRFDMPPITHDYIVDNCKYTNTYYIALAKDPDTLPFVEITNNDQLTEIMDIQWVGVDQVNYLNLHYDDIRKRTKEIFHQVTNIIKKKNLI